MFTVWLTGLPCSGKSTLAEALVKELTRRKRPVQLLDGDVIRRQWPGGVGFSKQDRVENVRRIAFGCRLLNDHGVAAIVAVIAPYRALRDEARASLPTFLEVYVDASLETCIARDVKGMYKKALAGEIPDFTGVGSPYEPPLNPELVVHTDRETPGESIATVLQELEKRSLILP